MKMIAEHQTNLCRHCKMQREADMIKIENESKNFRRHKAIKGFTCELDKGCYGLLGPNGAGKTTLLRCILGLYPVSEGVVSLQKGEQIGYLPQRFGMFHELKVKEMMYYFAAAKKVSKEKREAEIERVLADVNLSEKAEEKVGHLSGGMQRRLGIAQAILGDPDILFLDEPTTGLDPEERSHFKEIIRKLAKDDKIIVISTHIVQEVEAVCDRVLIMKDGTLLENVTVEEACHFAGDDNATLEQGYLQRLKEA